MPTAQREIDDCPWRRPASNEPHGQSACRLLGRVTGITDDSLLAVDHAACQACCETFAPTEQDMNPVVASLLCQLAESIIEQRIATPECTIERARELRSRALDNIPTLSPDDHEFHVEEVRPPESFADVSVTDLKRLLPTPPTRFGVVDKWAVAVTTAPRRDATLPICLERLTAAGWNAPTVFIDGAVEFPQKFSDLPQTRRTPTTGAWPNSYLALLELYLRQPEADAYLLVQDDVIFPGTPAVRRYLEAAFWPGDRPGIVSLFCSSQYTQQQPGWSAIDETWVWGAQALAFHPEVLQQFLTSTMAYEHRRRTDKPRIGLTHVDVLIGQWAEANDVPVWFPTPSLAQHIGHVSSLWETSRALGLRRADCYVEDVLIPVAT